jgi:hypothetical protein
MTCHRKSDPLTPIHYTITYNLARHKRYLVEGLTLTRREFEKLYDDNK